jgi:DNA-binding transcriptional ArsR family regulator
MAKWSTIGIEVTMTHTTSLSDRTREFLRALASENRQQVLLLFTDGQPRSVGRIAAELGIGQSTASEQLAILRRGGLVRSERDGKTVNYSADRAGILAALGELQAILQACCPPD